MSLGPAEMAIIFVVVLLLFGAKKLPELARGMGKAMGEFKSARQEFENEIRRAEYEIKEEPKRQLAAPRRPEPAPTPAKTEEPKAETASAPESSEASSSDSSSEKEKSAETV